jgi:hypothetical protein
MSVRHKKTRKQKVVADFRHGVYTLNTEKIPTPEPAVASINADKIAHSYSYVMPDVIKTGLLTLSMLVTQTILFFLLKNHIITIPGINY